MTRGWERAAWLVAAAALVLAACGDDGGDEPAATGPTTAAPTTEPSTGTAGEAGDEGATAEDADVEPLVVLVSNDDGVSAPGIDALVEALREQPGVEVYVSAPAEDQSGSGDDTTPGGVEASEARTASGYPAVAVHGEPADSVAHALDTLFADEPPDLVIAGINEGQNLGPIVEISGTVGAARTAARRGIPAVAVSQGNPHPGQEPDWEAGVRALLDWFVENRDRLVPGTVVNINVPTCVPGTSIRGTVVVPTAAHAESGNPVEPADCASTLTDPVDDIAAFRAGFVAVSDPGLGS